MALHILTPLFLRVRDMGELLYLFHASGRVIIVDVGVVARKTFGAEQLFVIKRSVCFAELCMPLVGDFPQAIISWHDVLLLHYFITQYADAFDFEFDNVAATEPGMYFGAYFEQASGADGAGAEYVARAQAGVARGPGDHLGEAVIDVFEVATRDFLTIDTRQHGHVVAFAGIAAGAVGSQ